MYCFGIFLLVKVQCFRILLRSRFSFNEDFIFSVMSMFLHTRIIPAGISYCESFTARVFFPLDSEILHLYCEGRGFANKPGTVQVGAPFVFQLTRQRQCSRYERVRKVDSSVWG